MHDILPPSADDGKGFRSSHFQFVEDTVRHWLEAYGYQEIRMPIVEDTALFKRSIGEVTDIVEKEMYTFADRNGDSLTLRPEGTASVVRAAIEHSALRQATHRWWYSGPMFRHERPQRGRYRQFTQIGVEAFGMSGPDIDAEIILLTARLWKALGLRHVALQINNLGCAEARANFREALTAYLRAHEAQLDEDSRRRLETNPLRILDSKNAEVQAVIGRGPTLLDFLDETSKAHFAGLRGLLDRAGVAYEINPHLVRGLDYYTGTVFEWVTTLLGAQGTVCAGGRYDGLVAQLGGPATPAIGFAMGVERLVELVKEEQSVPADPVPHVYLVAVGDEPAAQAMILAESLRESADGLRVMLHCGGGSFKSQVKRADKSGAPLALVLGESELERGEVGVKFLREEKPQIAVGRDGIVQWLNEWLGQHG